MFKNDFDQRKNKSGSQFNALIYIKYLIKNVKYNHFNIIRFS